MFAFSSLGCVCALTLLKFHSEVLQLPYISTCMYQRHACTCTRLSVQGHIITYQYHVPGQVVCMHMASHTARDMLCQLGVRIYQARGAGVHACMLQE